MKMFITLCFVVGLCSGVFSLKSDVFLQATCPAVQDKIDQVEQSYNVRYEYRITASTGTYDNVRAQCYAMGGDLLSVSMKAENSQYHESIRNLVTQAGQELFVGLNDRGEEGVWRFPSNEYFDPNSYGALFEWASGEPNNSSGDYGDDDLDHDGENCTIVNLGQKLNDWPCHWAKHHGLCEVKVYDC